MLFAPLQAGIPEYWIVNPLDQPLTVLTLREGGRYREHGVFKSGSRATSALFPEFSADVNQVVDAAHLDDRDRE